MFWARLICWGSLACLLAQPALAWRLEVGGFNAKNTFNDPTFTVVTFQEPFDTVPVVVTLGSQQGGDPSDLRLRNITTTGFEVVQAEPQGRDGPHIPMATFYIAAETGQQRFPDGTLVHVGRVTSSAIQASGTAGTWEQVTFNTPLPATPAVVANIQTMASESGNPPANTSQPWLTTVVNNAAPTGFDIAMERSQTTAGTPGAESLGYIAITSGASGQFLSNGGQTVNWSAARTPATVQGWSDGCHTVTYSSQSFSTPRIVATKNSRTNSDGGWLRRCAITGTTIELRVDEDTAVDGERNHPGQVAGIIAFDRSFHASFDVNLNVVKSVSVLEDPINGTDQPFMISGARARYTIDFTSNGNISPDQNSLRFVDAIPENMALRVTDISGPGSGPVGWQDGNPSSGLTFTYTSLDSPSDDIRFSNDDGASFSYVPVAGTDGADPAITHIEVTPKGVFAPEDAGGVPSFTLTLDMIVQ